MNILGIHYGHNATVAYLKDGELIFVCSEERFNRLKNSNGFPVKTLEYVYKNYIKPEDVDRAILFQEDILGYAEMKRHHFQSVRDFAGNNKNFDRRYSFVQHLLSKSRIYYPIRTILGKMRRSLQLWIDRATKESLNYYSKMLQLPPEKVYFVNHHKSHAYATCFSLDPKKHTLIFTMDGEGDGLSSTVNIYHDFSLESISTNPRTVSLGHLYTEITKLLGMTPNEHEFKVMGLAPYAKQERAAALYERYKNLLVLNDKLEFVAKYPTNRLTFYLLEELYGQRFDTIAAFVQLFLEEKVLEWVRAWIAKTGLHDLALSGGVFMNVKLNQKISELPEVGSLYVMPSAADECTPLGAAFWGYVSACREQGKVPSPKPLTHLYLGNEYSDEVIKAFISERGLDKKYHVEYFGEQFALEKKVARVLHEGHVVARFKGVMEWGARALGNRSILANPSNRDTVRVINEMIKNRDFWMPFAASILEEDAGRYIHNPKKIQASFMAITFNTTLEAHGHLTAALHPYDFTCRPQLVSKETNPSYHALITAFKEQAGISGILNTSFNLHGEPNVESPADAVHTLENSGLRYLALGNFLITKK